MNIHDLREAQSMFESRVENVIKDREPLHQIRERFIQHFTPARIWAMNVETYAAGYGKPSTGFNFCYTLERQLDGLGRTLGATASKYAIYFSQKQQRLLITKKWGTTVAQVFPALKQSIIDLINAGKKNDLAEIAKNQLSPMFKGKILATYFPDQYLNIFSIDHLNYFLTQLDLDTPNLIKADAIYKKQALVEFKNNDDVMRHWSVDIFSHFLYNYYPRGPQKEDKPINDPLADYRLPDFPPIPTPFIVDLNIDPPIPNQGSNGRSHGSSNPDYEAQARKQKRLGDRGEKIVLDMERKRLRDAGKLKLAAKVKKTKYDYEGYDLHSFEEDGTPRYIEVKATTASPGKVNFFLSANELKKAIELDNYYVCVVFEILKPQPKVWVMDNPFNPENTKVIKIPVSYRIVINTSKKST